MSNDTDKTDKAQISSGSNAKRFILAGKARVTLVSQKTGARYTYRITKKMGEDAADRGPHFVKVLTGPDNTTSYTFLGTIFEGSTYRHGKKSPIGEGTGSAKAFAWAWSYLAKGELPPGCEVWHEGCCGKCGKALTVPESIACGFGPDCRRHV